MAWRPAGSDGRNTGHDLDACGGVPPDNLSTRLRLDRGELLERNVGETDHSRLQTLLSHYLVNSEKQWSITVLTEQRVQVNAARFRVSDITVVAGPLPKAQILHEPPLLCIEILSPDDRMSTMQERVDDYLAFGVPCVWVINPGPDVALSILRKAYAKRRTEFCASSIPR